MKMEFWIKKHYQFNTVNEGDTVEKTESFVLAICDKEILGKKLKGLGVEGVTEISKNFYGGELVDEKELSNLINENLIAINAIGNNVVEFLIKKNIINESDVIEINEIKHAIVFFI